MPAKSVAQRALFAIAERHPDQLYAKNKGLAKLPHQTLHDFAATSGLKADGQAPLGGTMTNQSFQQAEQTSGARPEWMERATAHAADGRMCMADGRRPTAAPMPQYRVRATRITAQPLADGKWADKAFAKAGTPGHSLHATLGIPKDKKIPAKRLESALHSPNEHTRHMAQAAKNI